jgi:PIN domain nuclease of toxin-antitoxin system
VRVDRLLLDAHTVIWWDSGSKLLGSSAVRAIQNAAAVFVSASSEWELAIKAGLGKVLLRRSILQATLESGFEPLPVSFQHAQAVRHLKPVHRDPFDRLLVAVAQVEGLTLVSSDPSLAQYPIQVIPARR